MFPTRALAHRIGPDALNPGDVVVVEAKITRFVPQAPIRNHASSSRATMPSATDDMREWRCGFNLLAVTRLQKGPGEYRNEAEEGALLV